MLSVDAAINRVKRDITVGVALKALLAVVVLAAVLYVPSSSRLLVMSGIVGVWIFLGITSARSSLLASNSPSLIAAGQFDEAERQIDLALRAFTLFGPAKLRMLHQLALLRHAQRRWAESAALCRAVLAHRLGARTESVRPSQLVLLESLLELNDVQGAYVAIVSIYREQLSLDEILKLLPLQLDYETKIGAWAHAFSAAMAKVQLAELMPSRQSARCQAMIALAALRCGREDWTAWLRSRAELLADVNALAAERPILWDLWKKS